MRNAESPLRVKSAIGGTATAAKAGAEAAVTTSIEAAASATTTAQALSSNQAAPPPPPLSSKNDSPLVVRHLLPGLPADGILPYVMDRSVSFTLGRSRHRRSSNAVPSPAAAASGSTLPIRDEGGLSRAFSVQKIHLRPLPPTPAPTPVSSGRSESAKSRESSGISSPSRNSTSHDSPTTWREENSTEKRGPLPVTPHSCRRVLMKAVKNCRKNNNSTYKRERMSRSEDCLDSKLRMEDKAAVKDWPLDESVMNSREGNAETYRERRSSIDELTSYYSTWCVVRRSGKKEFGSRVCLRPRSMDVALLLKRSSGSPMLLPSSSGDREKCPLDHRGKFYVMKRTPSQESIERCDRKVS